MKYLYSFALFLIHISIFSQIIEIDYSKDYSNPITISKTDFKFTNLHFADTNRTATFTFQPADTSQGILIFFDYLNLNPTDTIILFDEKKALDTLPFYNNRYLSYKGSKQITISFQLSRIDSKEIRGELLQFPREKQVLPEFHYELLNNYKNKNFVEGGYYEIYYKLVHTGYTGYDDYSINNVECIIYASEDTVLDTDKDILLKKKYEGNNSNYFVYYNAMNLPLGKNYIISQADPFNIISDKEPNTIHIDSITIVPAVTDIEIKGFSINDEVYLDKELYYEIEYENNGNFPLEDNDLPSNIYSVYLSEDSLFDNSDIFLENRNYKNKIILTKEIAEEQKTYFILGVLDADSILEDINRENNVAYQKIYVFEKKTTPIKVDIFGYKQTKSTFFTNSNDSIFNFEIVYTIGSPNYTNLFDLPICYYLSTDSTFSKEEDKLIGSEKISDVSLKSTIRYSKSVALDRANISDSVYLFLYIDTSRVPDYQYNTDNVFKLPLKIFSEKDKIIAEPISNLTHVYQQGNLSTIAIGVELEFKVNNNPSNMEVSLSSRLHYTAEHFYSSDTILNVKDYLITNNESAQLYFNNGTDISSIKKSYNTDSISTTIPSGSYTLIEKLHFESINQELITKQNVSYISNDDIYQIRDIEQEDTIESCYTVIKNSYNSEKKFYIKPDVSDKLLYFELIDSDNDNSYRISSESDIHNNYNYYFTEQPNATVLFDLYDNCDIDEILIGCIEKRDIDLQFNQITIYDNKTINLSISSTYYLYPDYIPNIHIFYSSDSILDSNDSLLYDINYHYNIDVNKLKTLYSYSNLKLPEKINEDFYLLITIDPNNDIPESDENNNFYYQHFTPKQVATDFEYGITSLRTDKHLIYAGGKTIATVSFNDFFSYYKGYEIAVYISKDTIIDTNDRIIKNNESTYSRREYSIQFDYNTAEGEYYIIAELKDTTNTRYDYWTENNIAYTPIYVSNPEADIALERNSLFPWGKIGIGETLEAEVLIMNYGKNIVSELEISTFLSKDTILDIEDSCLFSYELNTQELDNLPLLIHSTAPNDSLKKTVVLFDSVPDIIGKYYIITEINHNKTIPEINFDNNIFVSELSIEEPNIEFSLEYPDTSIIQPKANEVTTFEVQLKNKSNILLDGDDEITIEYFISKDTILNTDDIQTVFQNSSKTPYRYSLSFKNFNRNNNYTVEAENTMFVPNVDSTGTYYILARISSNIEIDNSDISYKKIYLEKDLHKIIDSEILGVKISHDTIYSGSHIEFDIQLFKDITYSKETVDIYLCSSDTINIYRDKLINSRTLYSTDADTVSFHTKSDMNFFMNRGRYYIIVVYDFNNSQNDETNLLNNIVKLPVEVYPFVKFVTDSVNVDYDTVWLGDKISGKITVENKGSDKEQYITKYFLSKDTLLSIGDLFLHKGNNIEINGYKTIEYNFNISEYSDTLLEGLYYIIGTTEYSGYTINLTDSMSNQAFAPIYLKFKPYECELEKLQLQKDTIYAGTQEDSLFIDINFTDHKNVYSLSVTLYLSKDSLLDTNNDIVINRFSTKYINSNINEYLSYTIPDSITNGDYYLIASCEPSFWQNEQNKMNNIKSVPIHVIEPAATYSDLVIIKIEPEKDKVTLNEKIWVKSLIGNLDKDTTMNNIISTYLSTDNVLSADDTLIKTSTIYKINGLYSTRSTTSTISIPDNYSYGDYYIIQYIDSSNKTEESNEDNNTNFTKISYVQPTVDIEAVSSNIFGGAVASGSKTDIKLKLKNNGSLTSNSFTINLYLSVDSKLNTDSDALLDNFSWHEGIECYSNITISREVTIPSNISGLSYIIAEIIYNDNTQTDNEANNICSNEIIIQAPSTDLCIQDSIASSIKGYQGYEFPVESYVKNIGTNPTPVVNISYYLSKDETLDNDDIYISTELVESLQSGVYSFEQDLITITDEVVFGAYYIIMFVDPDNEIQESNEENNQVAIPVNIIKPGPDFIASKVEVREDVMIILPKEILKITLYFENYGYLRSEYLIEAAFYLSNDEVLDSRDQLMTTEPFEFPAIANSSLKSDYYYEFNIEIPDSLISDGKYILIKLNPNNSVYEEDFTNNIISFPVYLADDGGGYTVPVGINNIAKNKDCNQIKIAPNPASCYFFIHNKENKHNTIFIIDTKGNIVQQKQLNGNSPINVNMLSDGIYILKTDNSGDCIEKIIIRK